MTNLRAIPSIDEIVNNCEIKPLIDLYNRDFIVNQVRKVVDGIRQELKEKRDSVLSENIMTEIINRLKRQVQSISSGTLQKVINGTGVVLHTNLGRAPLGKTVLDHIQHIGSSYNNLEMDLEKGERGSRYYHVEELLRQLTGAEAALVVNNNAAAVLLGLTVMAAGKEVVVSRGQLVEIGGAFRIPDVMKLSGAKLVEVGTTNKTYSSDFFSAVNEETALFFSAHPSNYKIIGFTAEVSMRDLVILGQNFDIPVFMDLGSGILTNVDRYGLHGEPGVRDCVQAGVDIVTFSGDKLLGGPQAGIIVGKKKYVDMMRKHQLLRALRVDKLILAALEATLLEYLSGNPEKSIPVINMLAQNIEQLELKAIGLKEKILEKLADSGKIRQISVINIEDMVGGGAFPTYTLPGKGIEIEFADISLEAISKKLRMMKPALITRRQENRMLISVRTLLAGEDSVIVNMLGEALYTMI